MEPDHFIFSVHNDFFLLTTEEAVILADRGLTGQPLSINDFSEPLTKTQIYGFVHNKVRPISLDGDKIKTEEFWNLLKEVVTPQEV